VQQQQQAALRTGQKRYTATTTFPLFCYMHQLLLLKL
jgi:hypothetical protein